jgi:hypothetical protein
MSSQVVTFSVHNTVRILPLLHISCIQMDQRYGALILFGDACPLIILHNKEQEIEAGGGERQ